MKITEHEMRGLLAGKCLPGDMRVNEELPAYLVRKFHELQQKLDAMAAEVHNCRGFVAEHLGPEAELQFAGLDNNLAASILNSVRAEGVDMFSKHCFDKKAIRFWDSAGEEARMFAVSLRSGTHDTADKAG